MNHRSNDQSWGHGGRRGKRMMPPRRKMAPKGVAIIGQQAGKGFRLSPTQSRTPSDNDHPQAAPTRWNHRWWRQPHQRAANKAVRAQVEHIDGNTAAGRKDAISPDHTTTPPGRGTTLASIVVVGPAQHWTGLSPVVHGNETAAGRHKRRPTAAPADGGPPATKGRRPTGQSGHLRRPEQGPPPPKLRPGAAPPRPERSPASAGAGCPGPGDPRIHAGEAQIHARRRRCG